MRVDGFKLTRFSDEPRRSGRSTKGQHKNLEMPNAPAKKGKGKKGKAVKASAEEPTPDAEDQEETIRCICGEYEEEEDVERDMICCDQCLAWQHNDCMGLSFPKGQEPDEYFCEQCKPENHKVLLQAIARGEKPWEQVAEQRRREFEEQKASRGKKGKKGRKGRASEPRSDVKDQTSTPTPGAPGTSPASRRATSAASPARDDKNGLPGDSQKRKFEDHDAAQPDAVSTSYLSSSSFADRYSIRKENNKKSNRRQPHQERKTASPVPRIMRRRDERRLQRRPPLDLWKARRNYPTRAGRMLLALL